MLNVNKFIAILALVLLQNRNTTSERNTSRYSPNMEDRPIWFSIKSPREYLSSSLVVNHKLQSTPKNINSRSALPFWAVNHIT